MSSKYFTNKSVSNGVNSEKIVESYLVNLSEQDENHSSFWENYMFFLAQEREKKIDDIVEALHMGKTVKDTSGEYYRIVDAPYSCRPFCTKGSALQGGRFNFGKNITSSIDSFQSLYLANNNKTAFFEKYLFEEGSKIAKGNLVPEDMLFKKSKGYMCFQAKVELDSLIDLRRETALEEFIKVIKSIQAPESLKKEARQLGLGSLITVKDSEMLKKSLFEKNFKQWPIFINQPSNSQWFGHYVRQAKIQGIIYPSCREKEGSNLVIYLDTFSESSATVTLLSEFRHVAEQEKKINSSNYELFLK